MSREHFIECPKFGGQRAAPACVFFDRYKICRRVCDSLETHLKAHPDMPKTVKKKKKKKFKEVAFHAGKGLPNAELRCPFCKRFIAKSLRGLKTHCTRTHKKKLP